MATKHGIDRGTRVPEQRTESVRARLQPAALTKDPVHLALGECVRTAVRSRGAVLEPGRPFVAEAADPLVRGGAGHADGLGGAHHRPPFLLNPLDDQPSAERRELRPTMTHESLLPVRSSDKPQTVQGGSRLSTTFVGTTASSASAPVAARLRPGNDASVDWDRFSSRPDPGDERLAATALRYVPRTVTKTSGSCASSRLLLLVSEVGKARPAVGSPSEP